MAFTLVMLGTDTLFTPELNETLSVLATLIDCQDAVRQDNLPSPYVSDKVEVVIGPKTTGGNVNDRIQRGVLAILKAIARGEEDIVIMSHSRGAVETTIITHLIDAIKKRLHEAKVKETPITLPEVIKELAVLEQKATNRNTGSIMQTLASQKDYAELIQLISENVISNIGHKTTLHTTSLDPVPGNGPGIDWIDDRIFSYPEIVGDAEIYYYLNEHSRCFMPALVTCSDTSSTRLLRQILPGHHGTGSNGNSKDQAGWPTKGDASHVQLLVFFKFLAFLNSHGVNIKQVKDWPAAPDKSLLDNAKKIIESVNAPYTSFADERLLLPTCFKLYSDILNNISAYQHFNTTNYAWLGRTSDTDRYVHTEFSSGQVLAEFFPPVHGFVNSEHAEIAKKTLFKLLGLEQDNLTLKPVGIVNEATKALCDGITAANSNGNANGITHLLQNDAGKAQITEALSILMDSISQTYLRNNLPSKDKLELLNAIKNTFKQFNELEQTVGEGLKQFLINSQKHLRDNIGKKVMQQYASALGDTDNLVHRFKASQQKPVLKDKFSALIYGTFPPESNPEEDAQHHQLFEQAFKKAASHSGDSVTLIWQALKEELKTLSFWSPETLERVEQWTDSQLTEHFEKVLNDAPPPSLKDIRSAGKRLQHFRSDLTHFQEFGLELKFEKMAQRLEEKEHWLLAQAAGCDNIDYKSFSATFEKLQIAHGAPDRAKQVLETELNALKLNATQDKDMLVSENTLLRQGNLLFKRGADEKELHFQKEKQAWEQQRAELVSQIQQLKNDYSAISEALEKTKSEHQALLDSRDDFLGSAQAQQSEITQKDDVICSLLALNNKLSSDLLTFKQRFEASESTVEKLREELKQVKGKVPAQLEEAINQNKELTRVKELLEERIDNLEKQQSDRLTSLAERHQQIIDKLKATIARQEETINQLRRSFEHTEQENQSGQRMHIIALETSLADSTSFIQQHTQNKLTLESEIEQLKAACNQQQFKIEELTRQNTARSDATVNQHEPIISVNEAKLCLFIDEKLKPLTDNYLTYLEELPVDSNVTKKITCIQKMRDALNKPILPSQQIKAFYDELASSHEEIIKHRDAMWKRYVQNIVSFAAILATGILPGLAALAICSHYNRRNSLTFWQSHGEDFDDAVREEMLDEGVIEETQNGNLKLASLLK